MYQDPIATMSMKNGAEIVIRLCPSEAPNTVNSFISLSNRGLFDGHAIQRIVPGYVVDASYNAFSQEACKYLIANESRSHGVPNNLKMEPGVIAMGGYGEDGIAGGEFFFPLSYHAKLDGNYPAFGVILSGLEEILRWEQVPLRPVPYPQDPTIVVNEPVSPIVIASVRVETFGISYPEPVKLPMKNRPPSW
jgi:peptidyl-prolyl cis-trans isomerase B (cyclophilin B)